MAEAAEVGVPVPRLNTRSLVTALALLAVGGGIGEEITSRLIAEKFPDRPIPEDALFRILPYVSEARYLTAGALILAAVIFFWHVIARTPARLPELIAIFAIMYTSRAVIMILTPLADAHGPGPFVFPLQQHGMFPSGHIAVMMLFTRLIDEQEAPTLHRLELALLVTCSVAFVLSHGHYSIDVIGGLLLGYFVQQEWTNGSLFAFVKRMIAVR